MFNVIIICLASMLAYISKEMIFPILPIYLSENIGLTPLIIGLIEGITKAITSIVKFYSGYFSDQKQNRKFFIILGYFGFLLNKGFLIISHDWLLVSVAKIIERLGKAIKLAPQDAILVESSPQKQKGLIIGLQRTLDKLGATIGIIIAYLLIKEKIANYQLIFLLAAIPIMISLVVLCFIKHPDERKITMIDFNDLPKNIQFFFIMAFISALANSTESILILKAYHSGFNPANIILLYFVATFTTCLFAYPVGKLCDYLPQNKIVACAHFIFAITYFGLALTNNSVIVLLLFIMYGIFEALISVGAKAFIITNTPAAMKATALGINECLIGLATLPATIMAGTLWSIFGPYVAFLWSAIISFTAASIIFLKLKNNP